MSPKKNNYICRYICVKSFDHLPIRRVPQTLKEIHTLHCTYWSVFYAYGGFFLSFHLSLMCFIRVLLYAVWLYIPSPLERYDDRKIHSMKISFQIHNYKISSQSISTAGEFEILITFLLIKTNSYFLKNIWLICT